MAMIPEAAGATPYGIFVLADCYLSAAKLAQADSRIGAVPVRLLSSHAAELFLKTYIRAAGDTIDSMRRLNHDLGRIVDRAVGLGLRLPTGIASRAKALSEKNDYVRARYVVVDVPGDMSGEKAIRFCETIRGSVSKALDMDEFGAPRGNYLLNGVPIYYPR